MGIFQPEILPNDITIQSEQLRPQFSSLCSIVERDFHLFPEYSCTLLELLWFLVVVDSKLRKENLILLS